MKIVFIANGIIKFKGLPIVSGGDVRFIELGKRWQKKGIEVHVVTPQEGIDLCKKLGLNAIFHRVKNIEGSVILRYIERALRTKISKEFKDAIIYTVSDLLCDVLPAVQIKRHLKIPWIATVHWIEDPPWKRGLRFGRAWINGYLLCINQRITLSLIKRYADAAFAVSSHTAKQVIDFGVNSKKVYSVKCGIDQDLVERVVKEIKIKKYDACYMKRFHPAKGIFDVIKIWKKVCNKIKDAKLALVGYGPPHLIFQVNKLIREYKLNRNIDYLGVVYDTNKKFSILKMSKVLLHPSYEENWAIVIGEAMSCGTPVIAYDLPVLRDIWRMGIVRIPVGNIDGFANAVIKCLSNSDFLNRLSNEAKRMASQYSWNKIAEEELYLIKLTIQQRL